MGVRKGGGCDSTYGVSWSLMMKLHALAPVTWSSISKYFKVVGLGE